MKIKIPEFLTQSYLMKVAGVKNSGNFSGYISGRLHFPEQYKMKIIKHIDAMIEQLDKLKEELDGQRK